MNIGIDCDDVLCDFQKRFVALLNNMYGRPSLDTAPIDWDWSNCQVSKAEMSMAWKKSETITNLWYELEPLPSLDSETIHLLNIVSAIHDVFFITNRFITPGYSPLKQTKQWIEDHVSIVAPNVLIAKDKGPAAHLLQLDYFVDDRPKNCIDTAETRKEAKVYLADSSHNKTFNDPRFPRVKDLKEFLNIVIGGK